MPRRLQPYVVALLVVAITLILSVDIFEHNSLKSELTLSGIQVKVPRSRNDSKIGDPNAGGAGEFVLPRSRNDGSNGSALEPSRQYGTAFPEQVITAPVNNLPRLSATIVGRRRFSRWLKL